MKRVLAAIALMIFCIGLFVGCGNQETTQQEETIMVDDRSLDGKRVLFVGDSF